VIISLIAFVVALILNLSLQIVVLAILAPAVPIIQWIVREIKQQHESLDRLERLLSFANRSWHEVLKNGSDDQAADRTSRALQDEIFLHRESNQPIFDWIFLLLRRSQEDEMKAAADAMVEEAIQAHQETNQFKATN